MKQRFLHFTAGLCTALAAAFTLAGCREDAIIKSSLTPAVDNIHTFGIGPDFNNGTDTITMLTSTALEDTLITSTRGNGYPIFHTLGWVTDPFAGTTAGSIYMQVLPTTTGINFTASTVLDSLVLVLPYSGFTWGDTAVIARRTINVYPVLTTEIFSKDTTYYNYSFRNYDHTPIGTATLQTGPSRTGSIQDSVLAGGVNRAPHLRIRLTSQTFIDQFKAALPYDSSYAAFTALIPGFYIAPDTGGFGSAMPYFRLNGTAAVYGAAGLVAYTHNSANATDTLYQFPYREDYAAHFNRITRNYSGTQTGTLLQTGDSSIAVMQNGPGTAIDVRLPYIQSLFKDLMPKNAIINKAEIVFTKIAEPTNSGDRFFGPARIYPQGINASGGHYTIADRYPVSDASLDFIDGTPHTVVSGGATVTQYRINIPREIQNAIVQGSNGLHLRIGGTINFPAAYRLAVGGRGIHNSIYRPSINIIYSKQ